MTGDDLLAGRYRTLRLIGTGGMARVFLAEDQRLGRQVAVKRCTPTARRTSPAASSARRGWALR